MCFKLLLKSVIPCPDIKTYKRFLFIGAHSCDIEKAAGATACKLASMGKDVKFILTTNSVSCFSSDDGEEKKKEIIRKEAMASATILGVKEIEFLPFADFGNYEYNKLREELIKVIYEYKPDVVFLDDITTPNEIDIDAVNTVKAAQEAVMIVRNKVQTEKRGKDMVKIKALAYYNTIRPNYYMNVFGFAEQKFHAVTVHATRLPKKVENKIGYMKSYKRFVRISMARNGFKSFKLQAEAFRVVSVNSFANMPEINF